MNWVVIAYPGQWKVPAWRAQDLVEIRRQFASCSTTELRVMLGFHRAAAERGDTSDGLSMDALGFLVAELATRPDH
jgi:hypothetical protein